MIWRYQDGSLSRGRGSCCWWSQQQLSHGSGRPISVRCCHAKAPIESALSRRLAEAAPLCWDAVVPSLLWLRVHRRRRPHPGLLARACGMSVDCPTVSSSLCFISEFLRQYLVVYAHATTIPCSRRWRSATQEHG